MLNLFAPNTVIRSSEVNANTNNFSNYGLLCALTWVFPSTAILNDINKTYYSLPADVTWDRVDVVCGTAPTGANLILDIERSTDGGANWVTIFTNTANRPTVTAGNKTGNTTTIDVSNATGNSHIFRAVIDQIGSTVAGADITIMIKGKYDVD